MVGRADQFSSFLFWRFVTNIKMNYDKNAMGRLAWFWGDIPGIFVGSGPYQVGYQVYIRVRYLIIYQDVTFSARPADISMNVVFSCFNKMPDSQHIPSHPPPPKIIRLTERCIADRAIGERGEREREREKERGREEHKDRENERWRDIERINIGTNILIQIDTNCTNIDTNLYKLAQILIQISKTKRQVSRPNPDSLLVCWFLSR